MERFPVIVIGAGASGLAAAVSAAVSGARVLLVEASAKPGRSILASGNGRCNFANADLAPERYNDPAFVAGVMGADPLRPILGFFERLGLWYVADDEGRLFPRSRAAASVLDVLMGALETYGVELRLERRVARVSRRSDRFTVEFDDGEAVEAHAVVWAAGGGSARTVAAGLDLPLVEERPALCPLACAPRPNKALDGVRAQCGVSLLSRGRRVWGSEGEVLFRTYGLSGIVVFDASRLARPGDELELDLVPDIEEGRLADVLSRRVSDRRRLLATPEGCLRFFDGALHPKLATHFAGALLGPANRSRPDEDLPERMAHALKSWRFRVEGPADRSNAQVTQGGLATGAFDPRTLSCLEVPGFLACGEALDVDGECGGLNLAWAWSSGMVAGVSAARLVV